LKKFLKSLRHGTLWLVEVFVSSYLIRNIRSEPFQKATKEEKRYGGLFMAFIPAFFLVFMANRKSFGKVVDSMMYGQHSIIWLYLGVFILIGGIGGSLIVIGPKTPLSVSVPIAIVMWVIFGWYAWTYLI
jgi:hypothetical protein